MFVVRVKAWKQLRSGTKVEVDALLLVISVLEAIFEAPEYTLREGR